MSIEAIPIAVVFVGVFFIVLLSMEGGYRLGRLARQRSEEEKESPVSAISGAVLGLGAFMLAFAFGIAANRFDTRKELVREEANAIRTAYQRSDFIPEQDRAETKALIQQYLDARLAFAQLPGAQSKRAESFLAEAERTQVRLWDLAVANARQDMNSDVAALYIESLNEVFAIHALRIAVGLQMRMPAGVWLMLLAITALGMIGVGYQTGIAGSKRSLIQPILAVSFALVIALIADLDRPFGGYVRVTQQPLIDLQRSITTGK